MRWYGYRPLLLSIAAITLAVTLFWLCFCSTNYFRKTDKEKVLVKLRLLQRTISALERALDHLFVVGENINLDGVFGVRLVQDQLTAFLNQIVLRGTSAFQDLNLTTILLRLSKLQAKAHTFWNQFKLKYIRQDPAYAERLKSFLTVGSWDAWFPTKSIDRSLIPTYDFEFTMLESLGPNISDICMHEAANHCQFSENCFKTMAAPSYHGYSLTHELLYILNGIAVGCEKEIKKCAENFKNSNLDQLLAQETAAIFHEAELIADEAFPIYRQDLFMEQIAFGGLVGYRDFFKDEWLLKILSWQSDEGCFKMNATFFETELQKDFPQVMDVMKLPEQHDSSETHHHHRRKRNEDIIGDGCWSHLTAVAVAALGQYIRFLLEPLLD